MRHATCFAVTATLLLAACGKPEIPEQLPYAEPGAVLQVTPVGEGCGAGGSYRARVSWDVPPALSNKVEIQVGREHKVFARSDAAAGEEETGEWTSEGMVFSLLDRETDMLLAAVEAGPGNCAPAAGDTPG